MAVPALAQAQVIDEAAFFDWLSSAGPNWVKQGDVSHGLLGERCSLRTRNDNFEVYDCKDLRIPGLGPGTALVTLAKGEGRASGMVLTPEAPGLTLGAVQARYPEGKRTPLLAPHATRLLAEYGFVINGVMGSVLFSESDERNPVIDVSLEYVPR